MTAREIKEPRTLRAAAVALFLFGLTSMVGYALDSKALKGIGAATMLSPLPKVFSDVDGLETFASDFSLVFNRPDETVSEVKLTPEIYSRLGGPYKRRNVYGAAISYAPRLPNSLWQPVFRYAFCRGELLRELGITEPRAEVSVRIATKTAGRTDTWLLSAPCAP